MSNYDPQAISATAASENAYRLNQTEATSFERAYDKFLPRSEFQLYKEGFERDSATLKWFGGIALAVIAIFIAVMIFVVPNMLNRDDREAIKSFDSRLQALEQTLRDLGDKLTDIDAKLPVK
jgi:hypothetical protein